MNREAFHIVAFVVLRWVDNFYCENFVLAFDGSIIYLLTS